MVNTINRLLRQTDVSRNLFSLLWILFALVAFFSSAKFLYNAHLYSVIFELYYIKAIKYNALKTKKILIIFLFF